MTREKNVPRPRAIQPCLDIDKAIEEELQKVKREAEADAEP